MVEIEEKIPNGARLVMDTLLASGYEAYLVGGCVRDMLMGVVPKDWDICTNAVPEVVQSLFKSTHTVVPTGIKHGTVTIMVDGEGYEVTTYRIDGDYGDGRRPDTIEYAKSLKVDLARRDFSVNAMAYNSEVGIVDYYGGINDLDRRQLRCVGVPKDRFNEDSLRILRALRFASTKGFVIEPNTDKAIRSMYRQMSVLSAERILSEISKLLQGDYACEILMSYPDVFTFLMPELLSMLDCKQNNPHHIYNVWEHTCRVVKGVPKDEVLRFAALFHDAGKPFTKTTIEGVDHFYGHARMSAEITESVLRRLKSSNALIESVSILVVYHDGVLQSKVSVKRLLNKIGVEGVTQLLQLKEADALAQSDYDRESKLEVIQYVKGVLSELEVENACFSLKDLAINGNDLVTLGFKPGKELGRVLHHLLSDVIEETISNDKDVLVLRAMLYLVELSKEGIDTTM